MRIAVFGSGAVGGYFGGRLAEAGEEVVFIARGEHLKAIQTTGLRVESLNGDFMVKPANATDDPARVGVVDVVLVGVKAWQVPEAALGIKAMTGDMTYVVPLQNGVDAPAQLAAVLGKKHVLGGLCKIAGYLAGPGHIRHIAIEPFIAFGELDNRFSERVERLRAIFERAGVAVEVSSDIQASMWNKFIFIASISGVGAVTGAPVGVMRSVPETRHLLEQVIQEVAEVGRRHGVFLPTQVVPETMAVIDELPPQTTASMQRDILNGRPSELGSQNGAVVRLGLEVGVPTPANTYIYQSLLAKELRARGELDF